MAKFPALLLWTDAYLADTTHLSTEEHGAYMLLLIAAWRSDGCSLPDDDLLLARFCHCHHLRWRMRLRPVLERFFTIADGIWTQKRLTSERKHVEGISEKRREASAKSREAKPMKTNGAGSANAPANDPPNGPLSSTSTSKDSESKKERKNLPPPLETHDPRATDVADATRGGVGDIPPPAVSENILQRLQDSIGIPPAELRRRVELLVAQRGSAPAVELALIKGLEHATNPLAYAAGIVSRWSIQRDAAIEAAKAVAFEPEIDVIAESMAIHRAQWRAEQEIEGEELARTYCYEPEQTTGHVSQRSEDDFGRDIRSGQALH